jgi:predicted dehydrogenase
MRPRVGVVGLGWVGQCHLRALAKAELVDLVAVADPRPEARASVAPFAPYARAVETLDALLVDNTIDAVVIATPSALHAHQAVQCLQRGVAVFCQKPLARSRLEALNVVQAARAADRLLDVNLPYRGAEAVRAIKRLVERTRLGTIYSADFVFHNASGPEPRWSYDPHLAGGGCLFDLGIHLVDLMVWLLGWNRPQVIETRLFRQGQLWSVGDGAEDFAHVTFAGPAGAIARVMCSWHAPLGRDAHIEINLVGTAGGARMTNVNGSLYDFVAEHLHGTHSTRLVVSPDDWDSRAVVEWARMLARDRGYRPSAEHQVTLIDILDRVYTSALLPTREDVVSSVAS